MEEKQSLQKEILVIGHKNPDTDSVCSAIAYANLKKKLTGGNYVPCRAGFLNSETEYVLEHFGQPMPRLVTTVQMQVKDIPRRHSRAVSGELSLKEAWKMMSEEGRVTLAVTDPENHLEGLITIGDIANSYMNVYGSNILAEAHTPIQNIVSALEGELVVGDPDAFIDKGKVLVAANNMDILEGFIGENDIVMVGNRYDCQLCALDMHASCLVLCAGAPLTRTIRHMAELNHCSIIQTGLDTYTATRFIHQSMPIRFMMTKNALCFHVDDYVDKVKEVMASKRHRYFPVVDAENHYFGLLSRRDFMGAKGKQVILVDHNEKSQAVDGVENADILELIDHHRIGSLETVNPVFFRNEPVGCTATIIWQMYRENQLEIEPQIAGLLLSAILSDTLLFRSPTCTDLDRAAAASLADICGEEPQKLAKNMFSAASNLSGKADSDIFFQDYKVFNVEGKRIGIGQISSVMKEEMDARKEGLIRFMEDNHRPSGIDFGFLMLTSITDEVSDILCDCDEAENLLEKAYSSVHVEKRTGVLPGVVSRKKQFVPALISAIKE